MPIVQAPNGCRGIDTNEPLTVASAKALKAHGYDFVGRYIARGPSGATNNVTRAEIDLMHAAGLAVFPIQHVESETLWTPSLLKGQNYGAAAAEECLALGIPSGCSVGCDLEAIAPAIVPRITIAYCNAWFYKVIDAGYEPVLYFGDKCGLSAIQLYSDLAFRSYMRSYNSNNDQVPIVRGACIRQFAAKAADYPPGVDIAIDTDTVQTDSLGGLPSFFAPDGWLTSTT